jgi:quercetin dioxygenase-like cupin family protein
MATTTVTVREADESEQRWFCGGGRHTWVATAEETGGDFLMFEDALELGKVTPLHQHPEADETFYMLEGDILLNVDGEQRPLHAGGIAIIPRGVPHAFKATTATSRMLCLQTPGGGEAFYRQASDPATTGSLPTPVDFDRVRAAAQNTGAIEILGPPPF